MSADPRAIGCFDSGLGGLTVVRALLDLLPGERLVYFGDTGRFPYGPKPPEDVLKYSIEISDLLMARDVKMIVVACNSASAAALEHLRDHVPVPVTGVIEVERQLAGGVAGRQRQPRVVAEGVGDRSVQASPLGGEQPGIGHFAEQRMPDSVRVGVMIEIDEARELYGVVIDPATFAVDEEATKSLRK